MRILIALVICAVLVAGQTAWAAKNPPSRPQPVDPMPNSGGQNVDSGSTGSTTSGGKVDSAAVAALKSAEAAYATVTDPLTDGPKLRDALKTGLAQVEKFQQTQDYDHLVDCLFLVGNCYYELGEWANAEKFMTMCNELGNRYFPDQMGSAPLKVIGDSQYQQNKPEDALKSYQERVAKLDKQGATADAGERAGSLFDVGEMLIKLDRSPEALPILEQSETANAAAATALSKAGSTATQQDKDANVIDHAEIVYDQAISLFKQSKFPECRTRLEKALGLFDSIQSTGRENVADRMVSVLDDLVVVCDKVGDKTASDTYKARRDKLNQ